MGWSKARYDWYKSHGICPRCGQAKAAKGRTFCLNCLDSGAVETLKTKMRYPDNYKERNKTWCHDRYYKAKEQGICVRCFKNKAREGKTTCEKCYYKNKK